jgi:hypothetical protein
MDFGYRNALWGRIVLSFPGWELFKILTFKRMEDLNQTFIYNTEELSKLLKVSTRTIQRWRDMGQIVYSKIGQRKFYYMHQDVVEMLKNNSIKTFRNE